MKGVPVLIMSLIAVGVLSCEDEDHLGRHNPAQVPATPVILRHLNAAHELTDGEFLIAGASFSGNSQDRKVLVGRITGTGQPEWIKEYNVCESCEAWSVRPTPDGGELVLIVSWSDDSTPGIYLLKLDSDGNEVSTQQVDHCLRWLGRASPTADGGFAMTGIVHTGSWGGAGLLKIDAQGSTSFCREYGDSAVGEVVANCRDGGFVIFGHYNYAEPRLIRTNANGEVLWTQTSDTLRLNLGTIVQDEDGGFTLGGTTYSLVPIVEKLDTGGNILWSHAYSYSQVHDIRSLLRLSDGGMAMATWHLGFESPSDTYSIVRTDAYGALSWVSPSSIQEGAYGPTILNIGDGDVIIAGTEVLRGDAEYDENVYVGRVNSTGEFLWQRTFGD